MYRKDPLVTGEIYHIYTKSIADYTIFNDDMEFLRMKVYVVKPNGTEAMII